MLVYRLCGKEEVDNVISGNISNVGNNFFNDHTLNTHNYDINKKYLHFFKNKINILYFMCSPGKYICTYNIPDEILRTHTGKGFYYDIFNYTELVGEEEYCIENTLLDKKYLLEVDGILDYLDVDDFIDDDLSDKTIRVYTGGPMETYDSSTDTLKHINAVKSNLKVIRKKLLRYNVVGIEDNSLLSELVNLSKNRTYTKDELLLQMFENTYNTYGSKISIINIEDMLYLRGKHHDESKLVEPEKSKLDIYTPLLRTYSYYSDEYKENLEHLKDTMSHHYKYNRHHPEHFSNGIYGMDLIDAVEMLCDWKASVDRCSNSNIFDGIDINQERFGYSDEFSNVLKRTIEKNF